MVVGAREAHALRTMPMAVQQKKSGKSDARNTKLACIVSYSMMYSANLLYYEVKRENFAHFYLVPH
jgi:hypothetical protein